MTVTETADVALTALALGSLPAIFIAGGVAWVGGVGVPLRGALWIGLLLNAAALVRLRRRSEADA